MQKKKTILLVEDSRLMRKFVTDLLHQNGYEAKSALSGEDALQIISGGFLPDLILMDIELPGKIDGMEATRIITELCDIPVVFLTANTSPEITAKVREVNAYGFVLKGTDKAALLSTIDMALKLHRESVRSGMFERLFEISNDELYVFQPDSLNLVAVNKSAQKSLDYQPEELKSLTLMDINPELDAQKFKDTLKLLHDGKIEQVEMETLHRKKSGALYPVKLSLRLFNYEGKNYCLAMGSNLTSKKKLEIGLKEKEELINAIVNAAQDAIIMLDNDGCVTFWNPAAEKIFGYSKEEMLGKDLHRLVMPDPGFYNPYRDTFRHFIETGESDIIGKTLEIKARHKCGREIDVELSVSALKLEGVWHTVGIVRDISQRKKLQEELESSLKEYMDLAENAPIGITKCDSEGYVNYVNPKTMEILGPNSLDAVKRFNIFTAPEFCQHEFSKKLRDCMDLNKADICEMGYEPLQGKKTWLRIHINPLLGKRKVRGAQIIIDDITEKKQLEEKNRRAAEKMRLIIEGMPNPAWLV
ncbi:MAG: PAS domain S-box protein [Clostridiales bacterium]|nr:PAS domain S-box protein [Clostridiales bacterium]